MTGKKNFQPFFSIVIPTLDEESFLPALLTSLSKQTLTDFEVIVADGNSQDKTKAIACSFAEYLPSFKFLDISKRRASIQRNAGAQAAQGKYILFFDADSNINRHFLLHLHHQLKKEPVDFFTSKFNSDNLKLYDKFLMAMGNLFFMIAAFCSRPMFAAAFLGCKRKVFLKMGGFKENLTINDDFDFTLRSKQKGFSYKLIGQPRYAFSLRRMDHEGHFQVLAKYAFAFSHTILNINHRPAKIDYQMGGARYNK